MIKAFTMILLILFLLPIGAESKDLIITTLDNPPQAYLENDQPKGFLVDVVSAAVNRSGYTCVIKIVPWKRALRMVKKGQADAVFNAGYTKERSEYLFYPTNVLITEKVIALKCKGADIFLQSDLSNAKNMSVGIGRGFFYGDKIQSVIDANGFMRAEEVPNIEYNAKKLKLGRIDLFFADYFPAMKFLSEMDNGEGIELILDKKSGNPIMYGRSNTYLAFSKTNVSKYIAERINKELVQMKSDGTYISIIKKYIPTYEGFE